MSIVCDCPAGASIPTINPASCPVDMDQIQKVAFQRVFKTPGVKNQVEDITKKASWTPLLSAADGTKVTCSPNLNAPETTPGEERTFGDGNEVVGGIPISLGSSPTEFAAVIRRQPQSVIAQLKKMMCEEVGVYIFDINGMIGCLADNPSRPTKYEPIPIFSMFVGDYSFGGYDGTGSNNISWKFKPNWSDNLVFVKPEDFNPLTDLVNPDSDSLNEV